MIPNEYRQVIESFLPQNTPWGRIELEVGHIPEAHILARISPGSLVRRSIQWVTVPRAMRALETAGISVGNVITLNPKYADFETAAGMALLAHETYHQYQETSIPNFARRYAEVASDVDPARPWENPFELPAYQTECRVYETLVRAGWEPGSWVPLGVEVGLC